MAIGSYPRVTVQGTGNANNLQNGTGLMIFNSSTQKYEAATQSTFGGTGGATSANQDTQITWATLSNNNLDNILALIQSSTNFNVLTDAAYNQTLLSSDFSNNLFIDVPCKYVTLINIATNLPYLYKIGSFGDYLTLSPNTSIRINIQLSGDIYIKQAEPANQICQYIITT